MKQIEQYEKLKSLLKRKKKVPFSHLKEKLKLDDFDLQLLIVEFMLLKMENFNFKTPHQRNDYLKRAFIYLDYSNSLATDKEKQILIEKIKKLKYSINEVINRSKIGKDDESLLNKELLITLKEECEYTIMLLSFDFNKNKVNVELKGNEADLYSLLKYVIFKNDDINIFKSLVRCISFNDPILNKTIVNQVLEKYLEANNDYLKLYYKEILEEFLLNDHYLNIEDIKLINNRLKQVDLIPKEIVNFEKLKEKYGISLTFPYDYLEEINLLNDNDFIDLTNEKILVIDTEGTKLSENVFSFKADSNGYLLTLYVPAISLLVKDGSLMEQVAFQKGVTLFSSTLFPKEFLYDYCSLEPNKNRFTIGYQFYIDNDFGLVDVKACKAIINVKELLHQKDVVDILKSNDNSWIKDQLEVMSYLSYNLLNVKNRSGYFRAKDLNNKINNRFNRDDYDKVGRRIVDSLTIYSNHQMAKYFLENDLPFIYRNNDFREDTYLIEKIVKKNNNDELRQILDHLRVNSYFSAINNGHSGLKMDAYSQISTPCRNLAAYFCQKLIIDFLIDNNSLSDKENSLLKKQLEKISMHINERYKINQDFLTEASKIKKKGGLNGKKV